VKQLKRLLWIVPTLFAIGVLILALLTANALDGDIAYHQTLFASIQVRSNDFRDLQECPLSSRVLEPESHHISNGSPNLRGPGHTPLSQRTRMSRPRASGCSPCPIGYCLMFPTVREIPQDAGIAKLSEDGVVVGTGMGAHPRIPARLSTTGTASVPVPRLRPGRDAISLESDTRADVLAAIEGHVPGYG